MKCYGAALLLAVGISGLAPVSVSTQPVVARALAVERIDVEDGFLVITIRNTADRAITAWAIRGRIDYTDGTSQQPSESSSDGFISGFPLQGQPYAFRAFEPGTTLRRTRRIRTAGRTVSGGAFAPAAVVFDDGTAVGDETILARIFDYRARERRALQVLDALVNAGALTSMDPWLTAITLQRQLEAIEDTEIRQSLSYKGIAHNLSRAVREHAQNPAALRKLLGGVQVDTRGRRALADRHYQRR